MRYILSCLFFLCAIASHAQDATLKVATYNVDGLPQQLLGFNINGEGPGVMGTQQIAKKLNASGWDIIGLNEDFNYHDQLLAMNSLYNFQTYRGKVTASIVAIAAILAKAYRCDTDGLELATKKGIGVENETIVPWKAEAINGYFDHAEDSLAKKGFRYYLLTLPGGRKLDLIILHADASFPWDAKGDILAREAGMDQLYEFISKKVNTQNPMIIMGDFNCNSTRDRLQELFIDRLNTLPGVSAKDVRLDFEGEEEFDKIIYLNRDDAQFVLTPTHYEIVRNFVWAGDEQRQLSDHYPVTASFDITDRYPTGITEYAESSRSLSGCYNLQGMKCNRLSSEEEKSHGIYLVNGRKVVY